jgi:hypothetical protein
MLRFFVVTPDEVVELVAGIAIIVPIFLALELDPSAQG